jgi:Short C-terminal domain
MMRRRGPGLVGTMARTAVVAGTASAVSGAVVGDQQTEPMQQQSPATDQVAFDSQQQQTAATQAQQAQAGMAPADTPAAAAAAAAPANDLTSQLKQLADLKAAGVLSDAEFEAAKAKVLGG